MIRRCAVPVLAAVLACAGPAAAQPARPAARPATPAPAAPTPAPAAPVPSTPQQTTASFADWTLRCARPAAGPPLCEVVQGVQRDDRPVAQVALGRPARGQPLRLTVLVPPSVVLDAAPGLLPGREGDAAPVLQLSWRRCLPGGCLADAVAGDDLLNRLRGWTDPGRVVFEDGAGRPAVLPFSPRGLAPALDALAREDAG